MAEDVCYFRRGDQVYLGISPKLGRVTALTMEPGDVVLVAVLWDDCTSGRYTPDQLHRVIGCRGECPACLSERSHPHPAAPTLRECTRCKCLFGTVYLGESYAIVKPRMKAANGCEERPFDLTTLGSGGVGRRHGFYDPADGMITQVG